jgi:hypothetical protein
VRARRVQIESGRTLLVCAYDDEEKCQRFIFEGVLTLVAAKQ